MHGSLLECAPLWVAWQENCIHARQSGCCTDELTQSAGVTGHPVLARKMFRIHNHEHNIVPTDRLGLGRAAPAAGQASGPELEDQTQPETLVRLERRPAAGLFPAAARKAPPDPSSAAPRGPAASLPVPVPPLM